MIEALVDVVLTFLEFRLYTKLKQKFPFAPRILRGAFILGLLGIILFLSLDIYSVFK